jgi:hypothetical protein
MLNVLRRIMYKNPAWNKDNIEVVTKFPCSSGHTVI